MSPTGSGHNLDEISLLRNIVIPSGFFISEAVLAKNLLGPIPMLQGISNCVKIFACISLAKVNGWTGSCVTSRYPSSIETASMHSVVSESTLKIWLDMSLYNVKFGRSAISSGQSFFASHKG